MLICAVVVPVCSVVTAAETAQQKRPSAWELLRKYAEQQAKVTAPRSEERIVHFPRDRSMGKLYVLDRGRDFPTDDFYGWFPPNKKKWLGEAQGDVAVPANKMLRLDITEEAWKGGDAFAALEPDDIQIVTFRLYRSADDSALEGIGKLTGLDVLMTGAEMTGRGLRYLKGLDNLQYLYLGRTRSKSLAHLSELPSLRYLSFPGPSVTDAKIVNIGKITSLRELSLPNTNVGKGLAYLKGLKSLRYLNLEGNHNDAINEGLAHLADHTEMEELILRNTQVADAGLAHLTGMTKLRKLDLSSNPITGKITDAGMVHLKNLKSLEQLKLPYSGISDVGLSHLTELSSLKKLNVYSDSVTDEGLANLVKLKSLKELDISCNVRGRNITDAGMEKLSECACLKALSLQYCPITDKGLAQLAKLKSLTRLRIYKTQVTGDGLAVLKELPFLKDLTLDHMNLGETGIAQLAGLKSLERLNLAYLDIGIRNEDLAHLADLTSLKFLDIRLRDVSESSITNNGLVHLSNLTNLEFLRVSGNKKITDAGLKHLSNLKNIELLWFYNCPITDAGLKHLEGLTSLRTLVLWKSQVTEKGMAWLKKKIPRLMCGAPRSNVKPVRGTGQTGTMQRRSGQSQDRFRRKR